MRIFTTRWFSRFAGKERIGDRQLWEAVERAERGLIDADLGGGLIKQRVARVGGGRSGGYRTVIAFHTGRRSVFLYGFAKNDRENVDARELVDLKKLATHYLGFTNQQIEIALKESELRELRRDGP